MKRPVILIICLGIAAAVFAGSVLFYRQKTAEQIAPTTAQEITAQMVAQHNTAESCWVIAGSKVYSLTRLIEQKPELTSQIQPYCGSVLVQGVLSQSDYTKLLTQIEPFYIGLITP